MQTWLLLFGLVGVFGGVAGAIVLAGSIGRERTQISASLEAIEAIGGPVPDAMQRVYDKSFGERVGKPSMERMAKVSKALSGASWISNTNKKLEKAGNPAGWDAERILALKSIGAVGLFFFVGGVMLLGDRAVQAPLWGLGFGIFGFFVPDLLVMNKSQKRSAEILKALPDSMDLLTISVESGLAFDAAMAQVSQNTDGPLADEFARVLREIQIGSSRADALRALAERTDVEDLRIFLNSMLQAEKLGIPVADVLRVQSAEMRLKRSQRIEEKAMQLPVKIVFPLLLGIMPAMFIVILGPAVISISQNLLS